MSIDSEVTQNRPINISKQNDLQLQDIASGAFAWHLYPPSWVADFYRRSGKRIFDFLVASLLLLAMLPLLLFLIFLVTLDGGSPFFSHRRIGRDGRAFGCLKIRSMKRDAEERLAEILSADAAAALLWNTERKLINDPRITPIGRFIRKTSLDELPQIWNVIRGQMSLVGPRPVTEEELSLYGKFQTHYTSVRPGMTGYWQVCGRNSVSYTGRVKMDCEYVSKMSFWRDVKILIATLGVVLIGTGC